ncbi:hypothetical protein U1Q18_031261, partial [Sarracenia purpurea var. burkii]
GLAINDFERNLDVKPQDSEPLTSHSLNEDGFKGPEKHGRSGWDVGKYCPMHGAVAAEFFICTGKRVFIEAAVHVLVSLLRSGSLGAKMQAATVLGSSCKENEVRVKVLLEGCIPPLFGLLRSSSAEGQTAAAETIYVVFQGDARDHVG